MIETATAIYTGGNIWIFYGSLKDGSYFLTNDDGETSIFDTSPNNLNESLLEEWQEDHTIRKLTDESERNTFCIELMDFLKRSGRGIDCGMSDDEIDGYKDYMINP